MSQHVQEEEHRLRAERARILAAFRAFARTDDGRTVLAVLHASAGTTPGSRKSPFVFSTPGGDAIPDPAQRAAFIAGRQSILDEIETHLATPEDQQPAQPQAIGKPATKSGRRKR